MFQFLPDDLHSAYFHSWFKLSVIKRNPWLTTNAPTYSR
jgi:hypothetical protein